MFRKFAPLTSRLIASTVVIAGLVLANTAAIAQAKSQSPLLKPISVTAKAQPSANKAKVSAQMARVPLAFEANAGQQDSRVKFLSRGAGYTLFLTNDEA